MHAISVEKLKKQFRVAVPSQGTFFEKLRNYVLPHYQLVSAVNNISFKIEKGERVAFIGPNGAGKSTTLKVLTGIMQPTSGHVKVLGKDPSVHRTELAYKISAIFGHSSKLWYNLPVQETYSLLAAIYNLPKSAYQKRLSHLVEKFNITQLLTKPVCQLSLGERMRCEIVASFLHKPSVVFLDEPTIGLDITAKATIRDLLRKFSDEEGTTLLLTSHDTDGIEMVCDRVIIIDKGSLILDDSLVNLKTKYIRKKVLTVATEDEFITWRHVGTQILKSEPHHLKIEIDLRYVSVDKIISALIKNYSIKNLTIEGPPLEEIIGILYRSGSLAKSE